MDILKPQDIKINDFDYDLPDNKIAKYPLNKRDDSKLLVYNKEKITDSNFINIDGFLPQDGLMIFNNTKVIHARLKFNKATGAAIEIFCLEPYAPSDYLHNLQATTGCTWKCMIGNAKKWKEGNLTKTICVDNKEITLSAQNLVEKGDNIIEFKWNNSDYSFAELLDIIGELPIPPYLNRNTEQSDNERYQTLYSKIEGSVAAPTAGLHFSDNVFEKIRNKGIKIDEVTLHVGAGTFKPVKSDTIKEHEMHSEFISITRDTIQNLLTHKGKIIAVGTTSVRTLESLYYIGYLISKDKDLKEFNINQWLPYQIKEKDISKEESLQYILNYLDVNKQLILVANTQIMIVPGYKFKIVDAIITNFHQPKSTLLLLVSAFVNGNWKTIYNHALNHEYRFLSYGDSSLLL